MLDLLKGFLWPRLAVPPRLDQSPKPQSASSEVGSTDADVMGYSRPREDRNTEHGRSPPEDTDLGGVQDAESVHKPEMDADEWRIATELWSNRLGSTASSTGAMSDSDFPKS